MLQSYQVWQQKPLRIYSLVVEYWSRNNSRLMAMSWSQKQPFRLRTKRLLLSQNEPRLGRRRGGGVQETSQGPTWMIAHRIREFVAYNYSGIQQSNLSPTFSPLRSGGNQKEDRTRMRPCS